MITINDILENQVVPFEVDNPKIVNLFSFFLHRAPTISSRSAAQIEEKRLENNWNRFIDGFSDNYIFISNSCSNNTFNSYMSNCNLSEENKINRRSKGFVCKQSTNSAAPESDVKCLLRHLRNSIAHSNVFLINGGNRNYLLFDDYTPSSGNQSARILMSQSDLAKLKREIMK